MKIVTLFSCIAVAALLFSLSGCSSTASNPPNSSPTSAPGANADDSHAGHDHTAQSDMEKMQAELAKLSPEDAASAASQHVCPVSGEMLGKMGAPQKVDVNGHDVWICCDGCKDKLLANPDEYLAKLKQE
ncbi:MAG: hypothetical protein ABI614_22450 [Planctomycetota bacterium]